MGFIKFMKILKSVFLLFMLFLFIAVGILLQGGFVMKNTVFSVRYFEKKLDENDISGNISRVVEDVIENSEKSMIINNIDNNSLENNRAIEVTPEGQKLITSYKANLKDNSNIDLIKAEAIKTIKGSYGYFLLGNERLPVINIKPIKEIYINLFSQQIIMTSDKEISSQIDQMVPYIKLSSRLYPREVIIDEVMKLDQVKAINLSREAVTTVVDKILSSDSIKSEELYNYIVTEVVRDRIEFYKINEVKDELDLNLLINVKYGDNYNPVTAIATMLNTIKKIAFSTIVTVYIMLFLIIVVTAYNLRSILRWLGAGIVGSGIIGIIIYRFSGVINSNVISYFQSFNIQEKELDMTFTQDFTLSYLNGIWKMLLINSFILAILGVLLIVASLFIHLLFKKRTEDSSVVRTLSISKEKKTFILALRIAVVLILLIAIWAKTVTNINQIRTSVERYNNIKEKAEENAIDINEALGKVLNAEKFMDIMK